MGKKKKERKQTQLWQAFVHEEQEADRQRLRRLGSALLSPDGSQEHAVARCEHEHTLQR